jgi:hypothetical protein
LPTNISVLIGKAFREGKYLDMGYKNKGGELTQFWISILDIYYSPQIPKN